MAEQPLSKSARRRRNRKAREAQSHPQQPPQHTQQRIMKYEIPGDAITKPKGGEWSGEVTSKDLDDAGANTAYLLETGAILERGFAN